MPLRDHFRPPLDNVASWEEFHGQWPATIVQQLRKELPPGYVAGPRVHAGSQVEIDVAAYEKENAASSFERGRAAARRRRCGHLRPERRRRNRAAGLRRVRGPHLRRQAEPAPGCGHRDRQPREQGSAGEPQRVRRQVRRAAPEGRRRQHRRPGDRSPVQPVRRTDGVHRPQRPDAGRRAAPRCTPRRAGGCGRRSGRSSKPGRTPWPSASRCRRCPLADRCPRRAARPRSQLRSKPATISACGDECIRTPNESPSSFSMALRISGGMAQGAAGGNRRRRGSSRRRRQSRRELRCRGCGSS